MRSWRLGGERPIAADVRLVTASNNDLKCLLAFVVSATELAGMLDDSLHRKLLTLLDNTLVYPAHGGGSTCGKHLSSETVSTIGVQRRHNYAMQPVSKDEFIELATADQPEPAAYFSYNAMINRRERLTLEEALDGGASASTR
jgi:glyoxylase-like metal-dependent hydrolase (beta-lactamase superfamily II)